VDVSTCVRYILALSSSTTSSAFCHNSSSICAPGAAHQNCYKFKDATAARAVQVSADVRGTQ
jgi:hypothetical protein